MSLVLTEDHEYYLGNKKLDGLTSTIAEAGLIRSSDPWFMSRGTAIHKATEFWDRRTLDESTVDPKIQGYLASWIRFRKDQNYTPKEIEYRIYHPELMVATTIDRLPLCDLKSGVYELWHPLQLSFHWACLKAHGMQENAPMDVYLDPDGGPPKVRLYTQAEMREAFRIYSCLLVFIRWKREKGAK